MGSSRRINHEAWMGLYLIQRSGKQPIELRRMVTTPGGTTAEALLQFEKGGFSNLIKQAVSAAYNKAKRLGSEQQ